MQHEAKPADREEDWDSSVEIDFSKLVWAEQYKLLTSTIIPRPIALVTTNGPLGSNAAPFSFFNMVCADPAILMLSIGSSQAHKGGEKNTLSNLRFNGECVVHIVDDANAQLMNICAPDYPIGVDEIALAGFRTASSSRVSPTRLVDLPVQLECKLHSIQTIGRQPSYLVLVEVVCGHFRSDVIDTKMRIDMAAMNPIGRLASPGMYTRITDRFRMDIPKASL